MCLAEGQAVMAQLAEERQRQGDGEKLKPVLNSLITLLSEIRIGNMDWETRIMVGGNELLLAQGNIGSISPGIYCLF